MSLSTATSTGAMQALQPPPPPPSMAATMAAAAAAGFFPFHYGAAAAAAAAAAASSYPHHPATAATSPTSGSNASAHLGCSCSPLCITMNHHHHHHQQQQLHAEQRDGGMISTISPLPTARQHRCSLSTIL
jgi:hypothetical protein